MPRSASNASDNLENKDARMHQTLRVAAAAAILFDPAAAQVLFNLPDAELGRLVKASLMKVIGLATVLDLDLRSIRAQRGKKSDRTKSGTNRRTTTRQSLVAEGKLLRAVHVCDAFGITEKRLNQDVVSGRLFTVDIDSDQYVPAFFLANELDRKTLTKVVRRLGGLTGWSKWHFFTTPKTSLENLTPLQALLKGEVKQVLRTASAFVER
jgi:hypothetical protein